MLLSTLLRVYDAMQHGYYCWAEYHPGSIVNHGGAGFYEILCRKGTAIVQGCKVGSHVC